MQVTAVFDAVRVTNGVPQWWLAQAGLGTDDAAALGNADYDAMANWQGVEGQARVPGTGADMSLVDNQSRPRGARLPRTRGPAVSGSAATQSLRRPGRVRTPRWRRVRPG